MLRFFAIAALVSGLASGTVSASTIVDDFNDTNKSNWTDVLGSTTHNGTSVSGTNFALSTLNGATGNSYSVDVSTSASGTAFIGIALGVTSADDTLMVKIQNNNGSSGFDSIFFYRAVVGSLPAVSGEYLKLLSNPATSGTFFVTQNGDGTVTAGFNGESFTETLSTMFAGTGVGLAFYGSATADNFTNLAPVSAVPLPAGAVVLLTGLAGLGAVGSRRGRRLATARRVV
ncbi:VPLPA-CTERM sorting domain-containing protein [Puniceibacterium antarcticum]|nr:VPLPA-CTERM sorting domain-containing protein [Puniceibacterium antarcticum]